MRIPPDEFPQGFAEWLQPMLEARHRFVAGLSEVERWVCSVTVASFVDLGRGPTSAELGATRGHPDDAVDEALDRLNARDMLVLEAERVIALYPFSDRPGSHRVEVGGKRLDAM